MTTRQLCHFSGRAIQLKGKAGARDQRYTCVALITWRDNHVSVAGVITRTQIAAKRGCESQLNLKAVLQLQLSINKESLHGVNVPM